MRRLAVAVAAIALASAPIPARDVRLAATGTLPAAPRTVLALQPSWQKRTELLVRLDARTLRPVPGRTLPVRLLAGSAWSPGHHRLALAGWSGPVGPSGADWTTAAELRIVDPARLRVLHTVRLAPRGATLWALAWLGEREVATVVHQRGRFRLFVVNAATGAVERTTTLPGEVAGYASAGGRLGILLQVAPGMSPAMLAVVDAGGVRTLTLPEVAIGETPGEPLGRFTSPGLALSPDGATAYAQSAGGPVVAVDLSTLATTGHTITRPDGSLLDRLGSLLQGVAQAKSVGTFRCLATTPAGQLLVTGSDGDVLPDGNPTATAAGVTLIDPQTWNASVLSPDATQAAVAGSLVLGYGGLTNDDAPDVGVGLQVFGDRPYTLFGGRAVHLLVHVGRYAYAYDGESRQYTVIDLGTGRVVGHRHLLEPGSALIGDDDSSNCS